VQTDLSAIYTHVTSNDGNGAVLQLQASPAGSIVCCISPGELSDSPS